MLLLGSLTFHLLNNKEIDCRDIYRMEPDIKQDLSLLPGGYYHPEAHLVEIHFDPAKKLLWKRGHKLGWRLSPDRHGIWELYHPDGTITERQSWSFGKRHGFWKVYQKGGRPAADTFWYRDMPNKSIFPSLFQAATGLNYFPFIE